MVGRRTNLLYITRRFPGITFVLREVLEISRDERFNLRIISDDIGDGVVNGLRTAKGEILTAPLPPAIQSKTSYIQPGRGRLFVPNALMFVRRPAAYSSLAASLLRAHGIKRALKCLRDLFIGVMLLDEIRDIDVDRIHADFASTPTTLALVLSRLLDVPFTFTAHAQDASKQPRLLRYKASSAEAVITCANVNRDHLVNIVRPADRGKIVTIHHGIDFRTFRFERKKINEVPIVVAVGRMEPYKGFMYLVDALDLVRTRGGEFKARIIGGGLDFETIRARIEEKDLTARIELLGALPFTEVRKHLEGADLFIAPSITTEGGIVDGLPNVLIEAMASRTPIVASRISGIPEAVREGENGLLVEEKDAESLADAIQRLLNDRSLREKMGEVGYQIAREAFDLQENVEALKQVILGKRIELDRSPSPETPR